MGGRCSSKCTSTTAPMTWVTCPTGLAMDGPCYCTEIRVCGSSHRLGAGDDLDQLFGDHRLTSAVVGQCLFADHLAGVARGVVHCRHLRTVERGTILQKRGKNLDRDIARQKFDEDFVLIGFVFVNHTIVIAGVALEHGRNNLLSRRDLGDEDRKSTRLNSSHLGISYA